MSILRRLTARRDILDEIETQAEGPIEELPKALRRCLTLGGLTGSAALREWASLELKGYDGEIKVPTYREANGTLFGDTTGGVRHQVVPINYIPMDMLDDLEAGAAFRAPLAELIEIYEDARRRQQPIRRAPAGMSATTALINNEIAKDDHPDFPQLPRFERVYYQTDPSVIGRVMDSVRTTLVELVAEMRAARPGPDLLPTGAAAEQAAQVAVRGIGNRITVHQAVGDGAMVSSLVAGSTSRWGLRWTAIGSVAAVAAVVIALVTR